MRQIFLSLLAVFMLSCNNRTTTQINRDSIINNYFKMIDSSGVYDTDNLNYKALNAYVQNDTTSLKRIDSFIKNKKYNRLNWELWTSDIPLPQLKQLNVEEAFRFIISIQGAAYYEAITISKKNTAFRLHYLFYQHNRNSSTFDKIKQFEKNITKKEWNDLINKIENADFWGLKNDKDYRGKDGNDLTIIGYYKNNNEEKSHYVHRWTRTTLNDAFYYVYYKLLSKDERQFNK